MSQVSLTDELHRMVGHRGCVCSARGNRRYHLLDVGKTLRENLSRKCVMEYPEFHIVLKGKMEGFDLIQQGVSKCAM